MREPRSRGVAVPLCLCPVASVRLRLLPLLAIAHALGIAAADVGLIGREGALSLGTAGLGVAALARTAVLRGAGAVLAAGAAGALAIATRLDDAARDAPSEPTERIVDAELVAVRALETRTALDLETPRRDTEGRPVPRRVRWLGDTARDPGLASLMPGDVLRVALRLEPAESRHDPGVPDGRRRLARAGVGALGRQSSPGLWVTLERRGGVSARPALEALRARIRQRLAGRGPGGALLAALSVGDRRGLGADDRAAFARLGLTHLLSVSGLHLVIAAGLVFRLAFAGLRRVTAVARRDARRAALAVALAGTGSYALLAGFDVPVQRSLVFLIAATLAFVARRPLRAGDRLAAASLAVLAADPAALFDVGAQLSFAASAALLLARPLGQPDAARPETQARVWRSVREGLSTSALATAATAPLLAAQLGVSAPAGLVANVLAVPWTGLVLLPASFVAAVVAVLPEDRSWALLLDAAIALADRSLAVLRATAAAAGDLVAPGTAPPSTAVLIAGLAFTLVGLRTQRLRTRLVLALGAALLPVVAPAPSRLPLPPRVIVLDVGQGDATLVQGRAGTLLVDAGTAVPGGADLGRTVVIPALRALGVTRLDVVAVTHADLDHRGGIVSVLAAFAVGELWLPEGARSEPGLEPLVRAASLQRVPIREAGAGDAIAWRGDLAIETLWPEGSAVLRSARNERSLVLRVGVGGRHVLLPGDAGEPTETALVRAGIALRSEVLKLGHHGSRSASTDAWLRAIAPEIVVASAPCRGRFGMPHPVVVSRAAQVGASLWWTGRDGAVSIGLGGPVVATGEAPPDACSRRLEAAVRTYRPEPTARARALPQWRHVDGSRSPQPGRPGVQRPQLAHLRARS